MESLFNSKRYKRFIQDRDRSLEEIQLNAQTDVSRILFEALNHIDQVASQLAIKSKTISYFQLSHTFEQQILDIFSNVFFPIVKRIQRMRRATYTLSTLAELEAIGQATQKKKQLSPHEFKTKLEQIETAPNILDQELDKRVWLSLMRIRADILDQFRLGMVQDLDPTDLVDAVKKAFPEIIVYKRPPRTLNLLQEVGKKKPKDKLEFSFDFIDEEDWESAVNAYKATELPPSRFDQVAEYDPDKGYARYSWEIEKEITEDFVKTVREGTLDAANELGIKDFVWIAILDDRTDECCRERHGKTTTEIQAMLDSGELDASVCDAVTPPGHYFCRCNIGPVSQLDPVEGPDWKSFNEWLKT